MFCFLIIPVRSLKIYFLNRDVYKIVVVNINIHVFYRGPLCLELFLIQNIKRVEYNIYCCRVQKALQLRNSIKDLHSISTASINVYVHVYWHVWCHERRENKYSTRAYIKT